MGRRSSSDVFAPVEIPIHSNASISANASSAASSFQLTSENATGFGGLFTVTQDFMPPNIADGSMISTTLTCIDAVGGRTTVSSDPILFANSPPLEGSVSFPSLRWSAVADAWATAPTAGLLQLSWYGFTDAGSGLSVLGNAFSVCVGSQPLNCSVAEQRLPMNATGTHLDISAVAHGALFVSVTALNNIGLSLTVTTRLLIDSTPPEVGNLTVVGGRTYLGGTVVNTTTPSIEILGGVGDDDYENEALTIVWSTSVGGGGDPPPACAVAPSLANLYVASCDLVASASFCISAYGMNPAGLVSVTRTTCLLIDITPPTWPEARPLPCSPSILGLCLTLAFPSPSTTPSRAQPLYSSTGTPPAHRHLARAYGYVGTAD